MEEIKIDLNNIKRKELEIIVKYLKSGKVIVCPTDTIYGLSAVATNPEAVNKIYRIKKRGKKKPLLILVSSINMMKKYCYLSEKQREYIEKIQNKEKSPVSFLLKARSGNTVVVRLPKSDFLIKIIRKLKAPIVSTSFNISGKKPIRDPANLKMSFFNKLPDLIVNGGISKTKKPSKIIDIRDINNIIIVRK